MSKPYKTIESWSDPNSQLCLNVFRSFASSGGINKENLDEFVTKFLENYDAKPTVRPDENLTYDITIARFGKGLQAAITFPFIFYSEEGWNKFYIEWN